MERADGARAMLGHFVAMEPRTIYFDMSDVEGEEGILAHRTRENMSEQEPHTLRQAWMLRVQTPDKSDEGASAIVCR